MVIPLFGIRRFKRHSVQLLLILCVVVASATAAQASAHRSSASASILSLTVNNTVGSTTVSLTTNVPTRVTVATGTDKRYLVPGSTDHLARKHVVTLRGLASGAHYYALLTATPQAGQAIKKWLSLSTASPGTSPATASVKNGQILVNNQPWLPIATQYTPNLCFDTVAVGPLLNLHVDVFMNSVWACPNQDELLAAIAGKAWFTASLSKHSYDQGRQDGVDQNPAFIGWTQPQFVDSSFRPEELTTPDGTGKLTFVDFGSMIWAGESPEWVGTNSPPQWNMTTAQDYFGKADVVGYDGNPFDGECSKGPLSKVYTAIKSLTAASHKPAMEWVSLSLPVPACHASALKPDQAVSQIWTAIEAGAQGIGLRTGSHRTVRDAYDVEPDVASAASTAISRLQTMEPCLLTGSSVGVKTGSPDVKVRGCRYGGYLYLIATNTGEREVKTPLITGQRLISALVMWENRSLKPRGRTVLDGFKPLATHIYRLKVLTKKK